MTELNIETELTCLLICKTILKNMIEKDMLSKDQLSDLFEAAKKELKEDLQ